MAITLNNIITNLNSYLGDATEDRITNVERYQAITEATTWLLEELGNEHMVNTYELDYLDTINYYKVTTELADLLVGGDLRRPEGKNHQSFARKSPREISEEIANNQTGDPSWAIERRDGDAYLAVNATPEYSAQAIPIFKSITDWDTDGDTTNITLDTVEYKEGSGCLNFDIDVSASVTDTAILVNDSVGPLDLSQYEDIGSLVFDVYIPDAALTTSYTLEWGDGVADYWAATVTTDINGNAFTDGWNTLKVDWRDSTLNGTPNSGAITRFVITLTYDGAQGDDTDYRLDYMRIVQAEVLTFHYVSWNVGKNTGGTNITVYGATTDVPFYSGAYDQYRYAVAHKAASILFYSALRLVEQGSVEESEALKSLQRYHNNFESNKTREIKSFKIHGVNLRRGNRRR